MDDLIEVNLEHENKTIRALLTATEIEEVSNGRYLLFKPCTIRILYIL